MHRWCMRGPPGPIVAVDKGDICTSTCFESVGPSCGMLGYIQSETLQAASNVFAFRFCCPLYANDCCHDFWFYYVLYDVMGKHFLALMLSMTATGSSRISANDECKHLSSNVHG